MPALSASTSFAEPLPAAAAEAPSPSVRHLALAQIAPTLGDRRRNVERHLAQIERARDEGADLIVFPELSLTGYYLRDMVADMALASGAAELDQLTAAAAPADLVFGFVELGSGHRLYNSALYAEAGQVRHVHRKVYLPTYGLFDEQRYFARGSRIRAFDTAKFGRVGLLICEDFWHLSAATIMQAEEVDVLLCVANSPARGVAGQRPETSETYERLARTYAQLIGAVVVLVNRVGFEDGLCFWGGSLVVGPSGATIAQAPLLDEALVIAQLDAAELRRERLITPLARDERLLITIEELKRIKRQRYR